MNPSLTCQDKRTSCWAVTRHCFHFPNLKNKAVHQKNFLNNSAASHAVSETYGYSISTTFSFDEVIFGKLISCGAESPEAETLLHPLLSVYIDFPLE